MSTPKIETEPRERAERNLTTPEFRTLAEIGSITVRKPGPRKAGVEIRVAVRVGPSGRPALDVREHLTRPGDITWKSHEGPTRRGFWLSSIDAELLTEMMAAGLVALESVDVDENGEMIATPAA